MSESGTNPLLSIITVTLNSEVYLEETIESVLSQPYKNFEYIIIDGGSTDGTLDIIEKYADKLAYWISEPDNGMYHAMNKGIAVAKGEIIGIINADDYFYPDAFQKVVDAFRGQSLEDHIFWGDMVHKGQVIKGWREHNLFRGAFAPHPGMFCPSAVYGKVGVYCENYKILGDYDFMYRAVHKFGVKPIYLPENIAFFREGGWASQNITASFLEEMKIKISNGQNRFKAFFTYMVKIIRYRILKILGLWSY